MFQAVKVYHIICLTFTIPFISGSIQRHDPLQPVWDDIEQLPSKILSETKRILNSHSANINDEMTHKTEEFKSALQSAIQSKANVQVKTPSDEAGIALEELMTNSLKQAFDTFYKTRMKQDDEAAPESDSIIASLEETGSKLTCHLDKMLRKSDFMFDFNATAEDHVYEIMREGERRQLSIRNLDEQVNDIRLALTADETDFCSPVLDKLKFAISSLPSENRLAESEDALDETYKSVVEDLPSALHRDCWDILHLEPLSPSGVYTIYPTGDSQRKVDVWCDMETKRNDDSKPGWTVMLRRRNTSVGLLNFNRSWDEYAEGFGIPGEGGEWWLGLNWVHELTFHQPYELLFLLRDIEMEQFKAHYARFIVEDEYRNFRLSVDGFEGLINDAFGSFHHGQPFSTVDKDNDACECNCASNNQGGWWFNRCHRTVLTASFPESNDRSQKTIRWLTGGDYLTGHWLVLDDVTMMIKPVEIVLQ
ncbi:angiopoietin-2-like [Palaemon carinicauda]|uniref:angiopoietin-2-like n=1 Tax=Palaemon carinicauda TaxID=392227 RepID=UPI0035B64501